MHRHQLKFCLALSGLFCLTTACNQAPAPPPTDGGAKQHSEEIVASVPPTDSPEAAADEPVASPSDQRSPRDPRSRVTPYYEWTAAETAADALGRMGAAAVPELIEALHDPDPTVRLLASKVLSRIGPDAVLAVPDLVELLDDQEDRVRRAATRALGQIGPGAADSVPALIRLLEEAPDDKAPVP